MTCSAKLPGDSSFKYHLVPVTPTVLAVLCDCLNPILTAPAVWPGKLESFAIRVTPARLIDIPLPPWNIRDRRVNARGCFVDTKPAQPGVDHRAADTTPLEREIDALATDLYGLDADEKKLVGIR